jgi:aminoglycoside 6'-N-acetyltransferase
MAGMTQTWDGLEVAPDEPHGSTVVVRRPTMVDRDGTPTSAPSAPAVELLMLHRNAKGPDFEGDWAWTSPAGARQPGEAVFPAALRELEEEAGLVHADVFAIDLSGSWAVFGADVDAGATIDLVDPEHDRYAWLSPRACRERLLPAWVADAQVTRGAAVPTLPVTFRAMNHDDLPTVIEWQQAPHAERWFHGSSLTLEAAEERYGPRLDGEHVVAMLVVQIAGRDVGYVQHYRIGELDEYAVKTRAPDAVGFDYLIGDPAYVGRGLGTRMVWTMVRDVLVTTYPDIDQFIASPDHRNAASLRALAKCGFAAGDWIDMPSSTGEGVTTEVVCTFDRRHWFG